MKLLRHTSIDDVALYMGKGCEIHPNLLDFYHEELDYLARMGKVSLTPAMVFERFHRKIAA